MKKKTSKKASNKAAPAKTASLREAWDKAVKRRKGSAK